MFVLLIFLKLNHDDRLTFIFFHTTNQGMKDSQCERAVEYLSQTSELNYLTQIVFMQYEDPTADPLSEDRFHIEMFFR